MVVAMLTWRELRGLIIVLASGQVTKADPAHVWSTFASIFSSDTEAVANASESLLEQMVMVGVVPLRRLEAMFDKRWWYALAAEETIPIPPILRECTRGRIVSHGAVDPATLYIVKPHDGLRGIGIELRRGDDLPRCGTKEYVVQKRLVDCNVSVVRHFRVVTMFDGTLFAVFDMRARSAGRVISNGGSVYTCTRAVCQDLSPRSQDAITSLVEKLRGVHGRRMSDIVSVGWDVMLDCNASSGRVNAYVLEGNIMHSATFPGDGLTAAYRAKVDEYARR